MGRSVQSLFEAVAKVRSRGYSTPLERRTVDLAADVSFAEAGKKLEEHYNITVPITSIQRITKRHADRATKRLQEAVQESSSYSHYLETATALIAETDGTMVPVVNFKENDEQKDRRRLRKVEWKEAKLSLSGKPDATTRTFAATLGNPDQAGDQLRYCAVRQGLSMRTEVQCIGDGAPWIASQADRIFGANCTFVLDFYHAAEYLSKASKIHAPADPDKWLEKQKSDLRAGHVSRALDRLVVQPKDGKACEIEHCCPARKCYRYLMARRDQLGYKKAKLNGYPIGSGEVESAHRTIIQRRLKIPGAWWLPKTATDMLGLRCIRANQDWVAYWEDYQQEAA